jgi:hypothetical protein
MQPTPGDVHVNRLLSNFLHAYASEPGDFVADRVAPSIPVKHKSDYYSQYTKGDWFRLEVKRERGLGEEADSGGWTVDNSNTYVAKVFAFKAFIDDQTRDNEEDPIKTEQAATRYVAEQLRLKKEVDWFAAFFAGSLWTGGSGGATDQAGVSAGPGANQFLQWNDANSNPIEDVTAQMVAIKEKTGKMPTHLILTARVWFTGWKNHPDVLDRVKYTQRGVVTTELVASLLGLKEVVVASAIQNTAARGVATAMSFLGAKAALLVYVNENPTVIGTPTSMSCFSWTGQSGNSPMGTRVKKYRNEDKSSDVVEGSMAYALKLIGPDLGCFFATAVA